MVNDDPVPENEFAAEGSSPARDQPGSAAPIATVVSEPPRALSWGSGAMLLAWTVLADMAIFRTQGLAGPALFFALVPLFFWTPRQGRRTKLMFAVSGLLWMVSAKLAFSGTALAILSGLALVAALAMVRSGALPLVLETVTFGFRAAFDGVLWFSKRCWKTRDRVNGGRADSSARETSALLALLLPLVAMVVFGGIFIFANPKLANWTSVRLREFTDRITAWLEGVSMWELPFCLLAFFLGAGLLHSVLSKPLYGPSETRCSPSAPQRAPLYAAFRNTILALIVLFAVYLVFEFTTLWRRDFPPGFYYAGYAHQGAAWLTFALAIATGLLSLVFSGRMLGDPRLHRIRFLAWIWSAQNLLLAAAVYNRLAIYVGYNGMTQLRTVGFFGISVVVLGFALVLVKIVRGRGFWWLMRGQLIALALVVILYSAFPVDYVCHRYNVNQVLRGYLHPSVMIAVKSKDDAGVLPMLDLVDCDDPILRDGVHAMLAQRQIEIEEETRFGHWRSTRRPNHSVASPIRQEIPWHWTRYQGATTILYQRLVDHESKWSGYRNDPILRAAAIEKFEDHAMQWY